VVTETEKVKTSETYFALVFMMDAVEGIVLELSGD
jgi:hypothetical protein